MCKIYENKKDNTLINDVISDLVNHLNNYEVGKYSEIHVLKRIFKFLFECYNRDLIALDNIIEFDKFNSEGYVYVIMLALPCIMEKLNNENPSLLKKIMEAIQDYITRIYPNNKSIKHRQIFKKEHSEYLIKIYDVLNTAYNTKNFKSDFLIKFKSGPVIDKINITDLKTNIKVKHLNMSPSQFQTTSTSSKKDTTT